MEEICELRVAERERVRVQEMYRRQRGVGQRNNRDHGHMLDLFENLKAHIVCPRFYGCGEPDCSFIHPLEGFEADVLGEHFRDENPSDHFLKAVLRVRQRPLDMEVLSALAVLSHATGGGES